MKAKYYHVEFKKEGDTQVRTYPKKGQFQDRPSISVFLMSRDFLRDYRVIKIVENEYPGVFGRAIV